MPPVLYYLLGGGVWDLGQRLAGGPCLCWRMKLRGYRQDLLILSEATRKGGWLDVRAPSKDRNIPHAEADFCSPEQGAMPATRKKALEVKAIAGFCPKSWTSLCPCHHSHLMPGWSPSPKKNINYQQN